jgi:hypothetical protein
MDTQPRAPRLTDKLLQEDLPVLLSVADGEIEHLTSALERTGPSALTGDLRRHFEAKRERLVRSRAWLAGKVAAETHHRTEESAHE